MPVGPSLYNAGVKLTLAVRAQRLPATHTGEDEPSEYERTPGRNSPFHAAPQRRTGEYTHSSCWCSSLLLRAVQLRLRLKATYTRRIGSITRLAQGVTDQAERTGGP